MSTESSDDSDDAATATTIPKVTEFVPVKNWIDRTADHIRRKGKLELWTGLLGVKQLQTEAESHRKNREAEEQYVRKHVWGYDESAKDQESEMGDTILGDVTHLTTSQTNGASSMMKLLVAGLIGSMIPAAAIGGYVLAKMLTDKPDAVAPGDDATIDLGLGRIGDLLQGE